MERKTFYLFVLIFAILASGCTAASIAKQKKMAFLMGQQIDDIATQTVVLCNDGTLEKDDCDKVGKMINLCVKAQNAYADALIAVQNETGTKEQVAVALQTFQGLFSELLKFAIEQGIIKGGRK